MSTKRLLSPASQRQAEVNIKKTHNSFEGMIRDIPLSEVPVQYGNRNVNVVDYGNWFEGRPGSRQYSSTTPPAGTLYAQFDHKRKPVILSLRGNDVWMCDKTMTTWTLVLNTSGFLPVAAPAMFYAFEAEALLFAGAIFKIIISEDTTNPYMVCMSNAVPSHIPVAGDTEEDWDVVIPHVEITTVGYEREASLMYGTLLPAERTPKFCYQYVYGCANIKADSQSLNRFDTDAEIVSETGTCFSEDSKFQFEQWAFDEAGAETQRRRSTAMRAEPKVIIGALELPATACDATHFSIYRTRDIGDETNGNLQGEYIWAADVPVSKMFAGIVYYDSWMAATGLYFIQNDPSPGYVAEQLTSEDVGSCFDILINGSNATVRICEIRDYPGVGTFFSCQTTADGVSILTTTGTKFVGHIGKGRTFFTSINPTGVASTDLRLVNGYGDIFVLEDVGKQIRWIDGTYSLITEFADSGHVTIKDPVLYTSKFNFSLPAIGETYAYRRHWNDRIPDDGSRQGVPGLVQRLLAGDDWYLPLFSFIPHQACDIGIVEIGIISTAKRDASIVSYSDSATKPYACGQYRSNNQYEDLHGPIRTLAYIGGNLVVFLSDTTFINQLSNIMNIGNEKLGEYIPQLQSFSKIDSMRGVHHWQSIAMVDPGTVIALTNEPAIRMFTGAQWSEINLATVGGYAAVMSYLNNIKDIDGVVATYSMRDGYLIWFHRFVNTEDIVEEIDIEVDADEHPIYDCGGTSFTGDDVWVDLGGGGGVKGENIISDTGGTE